MLSASTNATTTGIALIGASRNARPLRPLPEPITDPPALTHLNVHRHDRLSGLLHEYEKASTPPSEWPATAADCLSTHSASDQPVRTQSRSASAASRAAVGSLMTWWEL